MLFWLGDWFGISILAFQTPGNVGHTLVDAVEMGQRLEPMVSLWEIDFWKLHAEIDFLLFGQQNQRENSFLLPTRSRVSCFLQFHLFVSFASTNRPVQFVLYTFFSPQRGGVVKKWVENGIHPPTQHVRLLLILDFFQVTIQNMHRHIWLQNCTNSMNSWGTTKTLSGPYCY